MSAVQSRLVPCAVCGQSFGFVPFSCLQCHATTELRPSEPWSFPVAYRRAQVVMNKATRGLDEPEDVGGGGFVGHARRAADRAAPALIRLVQALTLGTSPEELDRVRGGVRVMAELAIRQLAISGLKAGETMELDMSERFSKFMTGWFQEPREPVVLEHDPQEEARRLTP